MLAPDERLAHLAPSMRFSQKESSWILDQLHPAEWHFLCELPEIASGRGFDEASRQRLLPDPLNLPMEEKEKEAEFLSDWEEFVKPDLELAFRSAREKVEADLETVSVGDPPDISLPEDADESQKEALSELLSMNWRRIEVGIEDSDAWYSTLNQARILLNEVHDLAEDDSRFLNAMVREDDSEMDENKAMLLAQYEFYSVIQSILIDQVMDH